MNRTNDLVYFNIDIDHNDCIFMGITLNDIWNSIKCKINNILLIKSEFIGNDFQKNFELAEGQEQIETLIQEYNYGEMCFIDFENKDEIKFLSDQQVAEILFLGHMHRPLKRAFFKYVNNKFVYIGHDNGFFCKLYSYDATYYYTIIKDKIESFIKNTFQNNIKIEDDILFTSLQVKKNQGILFDLREIELKDNNIYLYIYIIDKVDDMDRLINEKNLLRKNAIKKSIIITL